MIVRGLKQPKDTERLPKNFPALQERMDTVRRSKAEKHQLKPRPTIETSASVEKDDTFFLL